MSFTVAVLAQAWHAATVIGLVAMMGCAVEGLVEVMAALVAAFHAAGDEIRRSPYAGGHDGQ